MRKIERLKKEALESCRFRGHKMKRFISYSPRRGFVYLTGTVAAAYAHCRVCDKQVIVITKPLPDEIEISGEAVALNCED
jgi:hypothetical protein